MTPLSEGRPVLEREPYFGVSRNAWRLESSHVDRGGTDGAPQGTSALCAAGDLRGLAAEGTIQVACREAIAFDLLQAVRAVVATSMVSPSRNVSSTVTLLDNVSNYGAFFDRSPHSLKIRSHPSPFKNNGYFPPSS
jgi:hypothetical protein